MNKLSGEAVIFLLITEVLKTYNIEPERVEALAAKIIPFICVCSSLSAKEREAVKEMFGKVMKTLETIDPEELSRQGKELLEELNKNIKVN